MLSSPTPPKPLIVVTGATGAQGGSVLRHLLLDGSFRVRGITRNLLSQKSQDLRNALATELSPNQAAAFELVQADYDDPDSLFRAFKDAWGVYAVTNYWDLLSEEHESAQGFRLVDAAKRAAVRHFVWSTMERTSNPSAPHWDSKATVNAYLEASGVPYTSLYTVFYFENFLSLPFFRLSWEEEGEEVAKQPAVRPVSPPPSPLCSSTSPPLSSSKSPNSNSNIPPTTPQTRPNGRHASNGHPQPPPHPQSQSHPPTTTTNGHKPHVHNGTEGCDRHHQVQVQAQVQAQERERESVLVANWPFLQSDGLIGGFSVAELGVYALEAFKHPQKYLYKSIRPITSIFTPHDLVAHISRALANAASSSAPFLPTTTSSLSPPTLNTAPEGDSSHAPETGNDDSADLGNSQSNGAEYTGDQEEEEERGTEEGTKSKSKSKTVPQPPWVVLRPTSRADFLSLGERLKAEWEDARRAGERGDGSWELWANMESFYKHDGNPGRDFDFAARVNPGRKDLAAFVNAHIAQLVPPHPQRPILPCRPVRAAHQGQDNTICEPSALATTSTAVKDANANANESPHCVSIDPRN